MPLSPLLHCKSAPSLAVGYICSLRFGMFSILLAASTMLMTSLCPRYFQLKGDERKSVRFFMEITASSLVRGRPELIGTLLAPLLLGEPPSCNTSLW
jgi:hypothetical protein